MTLLTGEERDDLGSEDFLTEEQADFMREYHKGKDLALTSYDLQVA